LRLGTLIPMNIEVMTKYPLSQGRIVVFQIRLHSKSPMLYSPALHDNWNALSLARRTPKDKLPTPTVPNTHVLQNRLVFLPDPIEHGFGSVWSLHWIDFSSLFKVWWQQCSVTAVPCCCCKLYHSKHNCHKTYSSHREVHSQRRQARDSPKQRPLSKQRESYDSCNIGSFDEIKKLTFHFWQGPSSPLKMGPTCCPKKISNKLPSNAA
jgi:hypothetical protein